MPGFAIINADHILVVGHHTGLAHRPAAVINNQPVNVHAAIGKRPAKFISRLIHTNKTDEHHVRTQCLQVRGRVRCATGCMLAGDLLDYRNRAFFAESCGCTFNVCIQHGVANAKDAQTPESAYDVDGHRGCGKHVSAVHIRR
jgi:hypothetical protein